MMKKSLKTSSTEAEEAEEAEANTDAHAERRFDGAVGDAEERLQTATRAMADKTHQHPNISVVAVADTQLVYDAVSCNG
jgi:hypothetical protein